MNNHPTLRDAAVRNLLPLHQQRDTSMEQERQNFADKAKLITAILDRFKLFVPSSKFLKYCLITALLLLYYPLEVPERPFPRR